MYDDQFSTVMYMRDLAVPPNWAKMVKNSSELVTTEQYDLSKTWFEGQDDPSADTVLQTPAVPNSVSALQNTIERSQASSTPNEGAHVQNSTANEGDDSASPLLSDPLQFPREKMH